MAKEAEGAAGPADAALAVEGKREGASPAGNENESLLRELPRYSTLLPAALGLAFSRVGILTGAYGSYESSDKGLFTDGAMLIALAALLLVLLALWLWKGQLEQRTVNGLGIACAAGEVASALTLVVLCHLGLMGGIWELLACAACTLFGSGCMFYWLRFLKGSASAMAAVTVFSALAASEVLTYIAALLPAPTDFGMAALMSLAQIPCAVIACRRPFSRDIDSDSFPADYFGLSASAIESRRFLIANAVGIGAMGVVSGFLRGYPDGLPIAFTPLTRLAYAGVVIAVCVAVMACVMHRRERVFTVGAFTLMEVCALFALFVFVLAPDRLDYGAVFATAMNAFMVGFVWYVTIAFMTAGWRDPYYYACAGWIIWLGSRAVARVALVEFNQFSVDTPLMVALIAVLAAVSAQLLQTQFMSINQKIVLRETIDGLAQTSAQASAHKAEEPCAPALSDDEALNWRSHIVRIMGLDIPDESAFERTPAIEEKVHQMGRQFLLSRREEEVLVLYAQGYTQKRVADALFISPETAHAHIKRIYAKTELHSRQEIIDYLESFTN